MGLKQTYGRVSRYGVTTLSWTLDNAGPMTKTVADNAHMLQVIAGRDPMDPVTTDDPVPDYSQALRDNVEGLRIGIPKNYFFEGTDPEADKAVRDAVQLLVDKGATTVDVEIPHADLAGQALWIIAMSEAACFHEKRLREQWDDFDLQIQRELGAAMFYTATDYIKANRIRTILQNEMQQAFRKCDIMAVPGSKNKPRELRTAEQPVPATMKPPRRRSVEATLDWEHDGLSGSGSSLRNVFGNTDLPDYDSALREAVRRVHALPRSSCL